MIVAIFTFFHLYFDVIYGYSCVVYWMAVSLYIIMFKAVSYPIWWFIGPYGLFLWLWMHIYFSTTYELISASPNTWVQKLFCVNIFSKYWLNSRKIRYISYVIIIIYLVVFGIAMPSGASSPAVVAMYALTCIAIVIDIFLAIVKIILFLLWVLVVYLLSLCFWSKEYREKMFQPGEDSVEEGSEVSSLEFEEYTVNSDESDEENKNEDNVRRMRIRRRGMLLILIFQI